MKFRRFHVALAASCVVALMASAGMAQIQTPITYQGELRVDGSIASGQYDMIFRAWDAPTGGTQLAAQLQANVDVANGRFTVLLDFGSGLYNKTPYIEIGVRPVGSSDPYTILTPRQRFTAVPNAGYSTFSANADFAGGAANANTLANQPPSFYQNAANLTTGVLADARIGTSVPRVANNQTFTGVNTFNNVNNAFSGIFTGSGAALTNLNADNITSGILANARTTGTASNLPGTLVLRDSTNTVRFGTLIATLFDGNGGNLTNLNAGAIATGTLANARTTGTVASAPNTLVLRDAAGNFGGNIISAITLAGNGSNITNLNASNIATGTLAAARLPALDASLITTGTLGAARLPATVARTDIGNAFGNFTNSFLGSVGIGTAAPAANLHVADFGVDVAILGPTTPGSTQLLLGTSAATNGTGTLQGVSASGSAWGDIVLNPTAGNVGVGIDPTVARFHVRSPGNIATLIDSDSPVGTWLSLNNRTGSVGTQRFWSLLNTGTGNGPNNGNLQFVVGQAIGTADLIPMVINRDGKVGIGTLTPSTALEVVGTTRTSVLEITGGSDIAEPYCVATTDGVEPAPGMVVSIDPDHIGKLRISNNAYDTTVAGIISGANGVNVGLTLRQEGNAHADGSLPIANVGRVWCWVDASNGPVQPGDLLTTSNTPGHAMKADPSRANGAILGKAMSRLDSGKGMVLVLVGLQ